MKTKFTQQPLVKISNFRFHQNPQSSFGDDTYVWTDRHNFPIICSFYEPYTKKT